MSPAAEVSVYDRMCWPEAELERALARGAHRRELAAYLGANEYATLAALARQSEAARRRRSARRGRLKLYLLPGILGSQLGRPRAAGEPPDLLWIDPTDIVNGRLVELRSPRAIPGKAPQRALQSQPLQPLGAVVYSYLALKLRLAAAGFEVVLYDYDWRGDVLASGRALADRLAADAAEELALIGHSMGGLLARAALAQYGRGDGAERITRLVGLGAPHGGSIAAVQALRATYPIVGRLAAMDRVHDAETLTRLAFRGFMSLYQLLPAGSATLDLFDPDCWPRSGARPDPALLRAARGFGNHLAGSDQRFFSIVGTGQRTVTGIERRGQQFRYQVSSAGDGTVASACATLPGVRNYSLRCEHSELPRSESVAAALIDLLQRGRTQRLREGVIARHGRSSYVTDAGLRRELGRKLDWHSLSIGERRRYLNRLNEPPAAYWPQAPGRR
ncbi:MAG: lipase family alpha/beta hydrolase [Steroidobacteraceae bacterium]|jgi:pimeloyl-ACP methyl ester carboxylesterase